MNRPRIAIPEPTSHEANYNRRSWPQYAEALEAAGGEAVRIELSASPAEIAQALATCQGVLLPGSPADVNPQKYGEPLAGSRPADPKREAADELLIQDAFNLHKPVLAICYGFQSMNVWLGGSLIQDLPSAGLPGSINHSPGRDVVEAHTVRIQPTSQLFGWAGALEVPVNSSHHQAIGRLGDALVAVASSPEDQVIEAAEVRGRAFALGIQWHPERTTSNPFSQRIFESFVEAARAWHPIPNGAVLSTERQRT